MYKPHSSIVPLLNLTALQTEKPKNPTALKVRFTERSSICDMMREPPISCGLFSDRSSSSMRQQQLLKDSLSCLDEEERIQKYAADPFFRQKVQFELTSLTKNCSPTLAAHPNERSYIPIEKTVKLIEEDCNTTFRKVKQQDIMSQGCERTAFQRMVKQGQLMIARKGKENGM